jgi:hypothetical protein
LRGKTPIKNGRDNVELKLIASVGMNLTVNETLPWEVAEYEQFLVVEIERLIHPATDLPFALRVNLPAVLEVIVMVVGDLKMVVERPLTRVTANSGVTLIGENALIGLEYLGEVFTHGYHDVKLILLKYALLASDSVEVQ